MPETWILIPAAFAVAAGGSVFILLAPRVLLVALLVLVRALADIGGSSDTGALLPNTVINGVVAAVAVIACLVPAKTRISPHLAAGATVAVAAIVFWTFVAFSHFGFSVSYGGECLRAISLVAVLVLAYRVGCDCATDLPRWLNWIVAVPACLLIVGYLAGLAPMLNPAGRATGTFGHANQAAAYFAVGIIACIWGYWQCRRTSSLLVAALALVALLLTQSLGALAAVAAGVIVLFSMNSKMAPGRRIFLLVTGLAVVVVLFVGIGATGRLAELEGVSYTDAETENSLDWRFVNWQMLIPIWWERAPLLGLGFGSTRFDIRPLGQAPHSVPVQLLVETGAVGFFMVGLAVFAVAKAIRRRYHQFPEEAAAAAAIVATVAIHALAANWLTYAAALYLTLFTVGALLGRAQPSAPSDESPSGAVRRPINQRVR